MLQFANYRDGKGFIAGGEHLFTYSRYNHTAIRFTEEVVVELNGKTHTILPGEVIEAWFGGVRHTGNLSAQHDQGERVDLYEYKLPLMHSEIQRAAEFLVSHLGKPYDTVNVLRFVPLVRAVVPAPAGTIWDRTHVFCTELAVEMSRHIGRPIIERCPAWQVPPRDPPRSPVLKFVGTMTTE
jgi:hypothetical protein